jgi:superfamily I DNA/RNA helicase
VDLTPQQQAVVDADGDFLLLACPGSGKTRSAAARIGRLADTRGVKVAACSYTNVGAERLGAVIAREVGVILRPQHFLGTIHSFLLQYVVYPFAHLLGAERGPHVREGGTWPDLAIGGDNTKRIALDAFRRDPEGGLVVTNKPIYVKETDAELIGLVGAQVLNRKRGLFRKAGALTGDDAMWLALCLLRKFPPIATAVCRRFDELLVDEAQDTSELQLACLKVLRESGALKSLVLIGDLEQSIYSFQGASAKGCTDLANATELRIESLTENHRCSQLICNVAARFTDGRDPDVAIGEHADCQIVPEVVVYPENDPAAVMATFRERLEVHSIEATDAAVMARRWKTADQLNGIEKSIKIEDRPFALGRLAADLAVGRLGRSQVRWLEQVIAYSAWDATGPDELDEVQRAAARKATYRLIQDLPPLAGDLRSWIRAGGKALTKVVAELVDEAEHKGGTLVRAKAEHQEHQTGDVFATPNEDLVAVTVHGMKGEEADAVMVVIHSPHPQDPTHQLELWETTAAGEELEAEREEERRVTFVALTRAKRYCLVALPDTPRGVAMAAACSDLGFALLD